MVSNFSIRKLALNPIHKTHLNGSPFKYYIKILGGGWSKVKLILFLKGGGVKNLVKHAYVILEHSLVDVPKI